MGRPKEFDPDLAVDEAIDLFWRRGYAGTTPQGLADALGIGKGSLYNAFGGKRSLFDAALQRYLDRRREFITTWAASGGTVKERLRGGLRILIDTDLADPGRAGCLATNSAVEFGREDEDAAARIRSLFDHTERTFASLITEGKHSGELRPEVDADAIASMLLATMTGMHALSRLEQGPERLLRAADAVVDLL